MPSIKCPHCGIFSPEGTARCDCGFDFKTGALTLKPEYDVPTSEKQKWARLLTVLNGALLVLNLAGIAMFATRGTLPSELLITENVYVAPLLALLGSVVAGTTPRQRALMFLNATLVLTYGAELLVASMGAGFL